MKAKRAEPKQEFVPVIVTLESQEEIDALFIVGNHPTISRTFPALGGLWSVLSCFTSNKKFELYDAFRTAIR